MFSTPILYIVFNRLDTVKQTFPKIAEQKPKQLFIAADGPRASKQGEDIKCKEVRDYVLSHIDWDCDVKTLFRDENLGCKYGVSGAIKWFFENVEQGIILEDDICVSNSFFSYCEQLLEYYKNDESVGMISAGNYFGKTEYSNYDYEFITIPGIWGWASWRRVIKNYSADSCSNYTNKKNKVIKNKQTSSFLKDAAQQAAENRIDTWDYQFVDYLVTNDMYTIMPTINLVTNIGFNNDSTHTSVAPDWYKPEKYEFSSTIRLEKSKYLCNKDILEIEKLCYHKENILFVIIDRFVGFLYFIYSKFIIKVVKNDN